MDVVRENHKTTNGRLHWPQGKTKMKKLIALALIALVSITAAFAAVQNVDINASMAATELTAKLSYADSIFDGDLAIFEDMTNSTKWNLEKAGNTKDFKILVSGNQNTDNNLKVSVEASAFHGFVNGKDTLAPNTVTVSTVSAKTKIAAGYHANDVLSTFHISWDGQPNKVIAGDYVSDVKVTYTIDK